MEKEKRLVPKPSNLDNPEHFILKMRRDNSVFKNRSWKFFDCMEGFDKGKVVDVIKVPDDKIVCDSCNSMLNSAIIDLLIYINEEGRAFIEKASCKECIEKYYSNLPVINQVKCRTCPNKIESFKNKISEKEFLISGMCQDCQDLVFEHIENEDD